MALFFIFVLYRGITLLSCIGKLFTYCLNHRLCSYIECQQIIGNEQAGFRSGHSTIDHIFALHTLIDLYLNKKKRLYGALIDYKKEFDVWIEHCCGREYWRVT